MADSSRIDELRRRVQLDPASIAFAGLAEEYRRAGRFEEAIAACLAGLERHPAYLSARVTLGRAFLETGRLDEARSELEHVLRLAPENLAAIRGLAEIHGRAREAPETHDHPEPSAGPPEPAAAPQPVRPVPLSSVPAPEGSAGAAPAADEPVASPAPTAAAAPQPVRVVQPAAAPEPEARSRAAPEPDARPEPSAGLREPVHEAPPPTRRRQLPARPEAAPEPDAVVADAIPDAAPAIVDAPITAPLRMAPPVVVEPPRVPDPGDPALPRLEAFLQAIVRARAASRPDAPLTAGR